MSTTLYSTVCLLCRSDKLQYSYRVAGISGPSRPAPPVVSKTDGTCIWLAWAPPANDGGAYIIRCIAKKFTMKFETRMHNVGGSRMVRYQIDTMDETTRRDSKRFCGGDVNQTVIAGLIRGHTYRWRVRAINIAGINSRPSAYSDFTSIEELPLRPLKRQVESKSGETSSSTGGSSGATEKSREKWVSDEALDGYRKYMAVASREPRGSAHNTTVLSGAEQPRGAAKNKVKGEVSGGAVSVMSRLSNDGADSKKKTLGATDSDFKTIDQSDGSDTAIPDEKKVDMRSAVEENITAQKAGGHLVGVAEVPGVPGVPGVTVVPGVTGVTGLTGVPGVTDVTGVPGVTRVPVVSGAAEASGVTRATGAPGVTFEDGALTVKRHDGKVTARNKKSADRKGKRPNEDNSARRRVPDAPPKPRVQTAVREAAAVAVVSPVLQEIPSLSDLGHQRHSSWKTATKSCYNVGARGAIDESGPSVVAVEHPLPPPLTTSHHQVHLATTWLDDDHKKTRRHRRQR